MDLSDGIRMKLKIVGFKVGKSGVISNNKRVVPPRQEVPPFDRVREAAALSIGYCVIDSIDKGAEFISVRRVDE